MIDAARSSPDAPPPPKRWEKSRLDPVLCAECGHPVSHMAQFVRGALAGGLCTYCTKDRFGKPKRVYTYAVVCKEPPI